MRHTDAEVLEGLQEHIDSGEALLGEIVQKTGIPTRPHPVWLLRETIAFYRIPSDNPATWRACRMMARLKLLRVEMEARTGG